MSYDFCSRVSTLHNNLQVAHLIKKQLLSKFCSSVVNIFVWDSVRNQIDLKGCMYLLKLLMSTNWILIQMNLQIGISSLSDDEHVVENLNEHGFVQGESAT